MFMGFMDIPALLEEVADSLTIETTAPYQLIMRGVHLIACLFKVRRGSCKVPTP